MATKTTYAKTKIPGVSEVYKFTERLQLTVNGERLRKNLTFTGTEAEYLAERAKVLKNLRAGIFPDQTRTVANLIAEWLPTAETASPNSNMTREWAADKITASIGKIRLANLRVSHIDKLLQDHSELSRSGQAKILNTARRALRYAEQREWIEKNPASAVDIPQTAVSADVEAIPLETVEKILKSVHGTDDELLVSLLLLGLRSGELRGLRWESVDFKNQTLHIATQARKTADGGLEIVPTKTKAGDRLLSLDPHQVGLLKAAKKSQTPKSEFVFANSVGNPLDASKLRRIMLRVITDAGVEHITPHQFRHSAATYMDMAGMTPSQISDALGHTNQVTTMTIYRDKFTQNKVTGSASIMESIRLAALTEPVTD